jgi:CrcB protein
MISGVSFESLLIVGLAGSLGALARYLVGRAIAERVGGSFPLGTVFINVSGAFLIGLLFALSGRKLLAPSLYLVLATGFLGGYTTFSTMSWEGIQLIRSGSLRQSVLYIGSTVALGFAAAALGLGLGWVIA